MKSLLSMFAVILLLSSCAHNFMRGTVAMKTGKSKAHICLGSNDVKKGDKIDFYSNLCTGFSGSNRDESGDIRECEMRIMGTGTVIKLLNSHYSEVETDGSFEISEGILVQKHK